MSYIGQLHGTYLLYQDNNHFYLIDQHAAYERINYEKIRKEFKKERTSSYELLVPLKLKFSLSESYLIVDKIDELEDMGILLEEFGNGTYIVREIPTWIPKGVETEFIEEIVTTIITNKKSEKYDFLDSLAKSLSCKKSIKANQFLDYKTGEYLLKDLGRCDNPYNCPHGRPVIVKLPITDIEKWFKRIV
jgi:DNA mismatch repair protein MutL